VSGAVYDVVVAGLGAMGSAAAYHLAARGLRILGLDAHTPGHARGSSHGETRIIRLSYFEHPSYVPLLRRAYALWRELEQRAHADLLRLTGGLYLGPPGSELVSGSRLSAEQHGLDHEVLDAAQVRRQFPQFHAAPETVALWEPDAGFLLPERCIAAHLRLAATHGASLHYDRPLLSWRPTGSGVEVATPAGTYHAARLVLTTGAWLDRFVPGEAAQRLALRVERNVPFWLRPAEQPAAFTPDRFPIFIWDTPGGHFYGVPHVERPGVKVARHHTDQFGDPDLIDRTPHAADEVPVRAFVQTHMPGLDGPVEHSEVCLYTLTPDGHFVVDAHPDCPQVVFASACSGHGFKFSSVVGELLADLATTGRTDTAAEFLRLGRLAPRRG
jgi:sarcosine oxidase